MRFSKPLTAAILHQRYKRFLADVELIAGHQQLTAHCPNTGAMTGCAEPGMRVWLSHSDNPKRKYAFTWELAETADGGMICVNTQRANSVAGEALAAGLIHELGTLQQLKAEVNYGTDRRRIDWLGTDAQQRQVYVEVKSVTLSRRPGLAEFPDSVTARGARHLEELAQVARQGHRAVLFYLVQRTDCTGFALASDIDPAYAAAARAAQAAGVEVICRACKIDPFGLSLAGELEPVLGGTGIFG